MENFCAVCIHCFGILEGWRREECDFQKKYAPYTGLTTNHPQNTSFFFFFIEFEPTSPWYMIRAKAFLNMHLLCVHLLCGLTSFCSSFCIGNLCCSLFNIMWHWQMLKRQSGVITVVHCHLLCIFNGMSQPVPIFQHLTIPFLLWRCCWHIWR